MRMYANSNNLNYLDRYVLNEFSVFRKLCDPELELHSSERTYGFLQRQKAENIGIEVGFNPLVEGIEGELGEFFEKSASASISLRSIHRWGLFSRKREKVLDKLTVKLRDPQIEKTELPVNHRGLSLGYRFGQEYVEADVPQRDGVTRLFKYPSNIIIEALEAIELAAHVDILSQPPPSETFQK